jgi:hypothetical protein
MKTRWRLFVGAGIWIVAVTYGMAILIDYSTAPGSPGAPPSVWPPGSSLGAYGDIPSLVLMIHPRCPCSRASLEELARLMARCGDRLRTHVLFLQPAGVPDDWWKTDLWASAAAIPGVDVRADGDGAESRRFGVETSGHALLYDKEGNLVFSGGITGSRGHAGDNAGLGAIEEWIEQGVTTRATTLVFGCALIGRAPAAGRGGAGWTR